MTDNLLDSLACLVLLIQHFPFTAIILTQIVFGVISGILCILGFFPYAFAVLTNPEVKPKKASWIIWLIIDTITFFGMLAAGTLNGQMIGIMIGVGIVCTLVLIKGEKGWTMLDKFSIIGAGIGIALWLLSGNPVIAIIIAAIVNAIGSIPTFASVWKNAKRENKLSWTIAFFSCLFAVLAIPHLTLGDTVQPIAFFINNGLIAAIIYIRPLWQQA